MIWSFCSAAELEETTADGSRSCAVARLTILHGSTVRLLNGDGGRERAQRGFSSKAFRNDWAQRRQKREARRKRRWELWGGGNGTRRRRATAAQAVGRRYTVPGRWWWRWQPAKTGEVK
ncbi:hypothetical protein CHU98_g10719 [Xylaria longipes]|nr:hypothetical protein CHU98_g10719 [Xylaria longipes]